MRGKVIFLIVVGAGVTSPLYLNAKLLNPGAQIIRDETTNSPILLMNARIDVRNYDII